jgi:hypothetical protein
MAASPHSQETVNQLFERNYVPVLWHMGVLGGLTARLDARAASALRKAGYVLSDCASFERTS